MRTKIIISGQIMGNHTLRKSISGYESEKPAMFNGFILTFKSKKEAVAAIREAYNSLVTEEPEQKGRFGGIRANEKRTELYYDASKAVVSRS